MSPSLVGKRESELGTMLSSKPRASRLADELY